jgi:hypothetical protein
MMPYYASYYRSNAPGHASTRRAIGREAKER